MTHRVPPRTVPKNMFSSFIAYVTMGANRASNEIRFVKAMNMIEGASKDVTHYILVNGVFKGEVEGSSSGNINWLFLTWAVLPTLWGLSQIKLPIQITYGVFKNMKVIINRVSFVLNCKTFRRRPEEEDHRPGRTGDTTPPLPRAKPCPWRAVLSLDHPLQSRTAAEVRRGYEQQEPPFLGLFWRERRRKPWPSSSSSSSFESWRTSCDSSRDQTWSLRV